MGRQMSTSRLSKVYNHHDGLPGRREKSSLSTGNRDKHPGGYAFQGESTAGYSHSVLREVARM